MALTPSTMMMPLGAEAPSFVLPDPSGKKHSLDDLVGTRGLVVMFICNHCPFVKHIQKELVTFAREVQGKGIGVVAINANDVGSHPEDSPEKMAVEQEEAGYSFPYLYDESQEIAKTYTAACTPDFFLFDGSRKLVYRGRFDDSRPGNGVPVTGNDLRRAVEVCLAGGEPLEPQLPSMGCNIKWKPGSTPSYFG